MQEDVRVAPRGLLAVLAALTFGCGVVGCGSSGQGSRSTSQATGVDVQQNGSFGGVLVGTEPYIWAAAPQSTHIFTMNVDGTNKTVLTGDDGSRTPEWTYDGKQIVYASMNQVWIMNADGSDKKQLTSLGSGANAPSV